MKVRDLMTSVVITVRPETSLKKVGTILARCGSRVCLSWTRTAG